MRDSFCCCRPEVYHHCLSGVRYDFLCANYTAFDQTLFNCNFVSNVDCTNSKKYWHRNDALYIEKSTTSTTSAPIIYSFYTPPPAGYSLQAIPRVRGKLGQLRESQIQQQVAVQVSPQVVESTQIEGQKSDQPAGQLTPQQIISQIGPQQVPVILSDYPAEPRRRTRPSSRRRPVYDYYDDYDEPPRRNRPRRPRPLYYEYDDYEEDRYERRGGRRRRPYDRMRPTRRDKDRRRKYEYYDDEADEEYDDYVLDKTPKSNQRRKYDDDYEDDTRRDRPNSRRPETKAEEKTSKRRKPNDEPKNPPRLGIRRPPSQDYEDELQSADKTESYDRRRKNSSEGYRKAPSDDTATVIKPTVGIYDRPRPAPKINLPIPKNAAYKPATPRSEIADEEEDEPVSKESRQSNSNIEEMHEEFSEISTRSFKRTKLDSNSAEAPRVNVLKRPVKSEDNSQDSSIPETSSNIKATTTTESFEKSDPIIRKFKRPLTAMRNFSGRNLKTSGEEDPKNDDGKAESTTAGLRSKLGAEESQERKARPVHTENPVTSDVSESTKKVEDNDSKSGPMRVKVPIRFTKFLKEKTTEEPKLDELYEKYDVTLNEASPVIDVPARSYLTAFGSTKDYAYNRYFKSSKL